MASANSQIASIRSSGCLARVNVWHNSVSFQAFYKNVKSGFVVLRTSWISLSGGTSILICCSYCTRDKVNKLDRPSVYYCRYIFFLTMEQWEAKPIAGGKSTKLNVCLTFYLEHYWLCYLNKDMVRFCFVISFIYRNPRMFSGAVNNYNHTK